MMELLDTAGQEEYTAMREQYIKFGDAFLIVYDICSRESFDAVKNFWEEVKRVKDKNGQVVLACVLGNKTDLEAKRVVHYEEGKKLADGLGCSFEECSAKTGENAEKGFFDLLRRIKMHWDMEKAELEKRKVLEEKERIKAEKKKNSRWRRLFSK